MEQANLKISHWLHIKGDIILKDGSPIASLQAGDDPAEAYRNMQFVYPKFFKMDPLCKWAWLAAESLLKKGDGFLYDGLDKNKIALVLATAHGCLEVDKKYNESIATIASPALFVYTLPNIMLGEICIRHGFKGEQACMVQDNFVVDEIWFWAKDLMDRHNMEACLCGWADVADKRHDVCFFWITRGNAGQAFSAAAMQNLYNA
ncbi:MAG: 3-oxoacyl-ACP synthase [Bacteroidetes bacterium]|nr:3-oxoacyl-ACP synthase [Bacteroidota bacterium]